MKLPAPEHREPEENVVPLINIVFLLLIFFMVAGTLTTSDPFEVEPPDAVSGEERAEDPLKLLLGSGGRYAMDGEEMSREQLLEGVESALEGHPDRVVEVKTDASLDSAAFLDFSESLRDAGVRRLVLVTEHDG